MSAVAPEKDDAAQPQPAALAMRAPSRAMPAQLRAASASPQPPAPLYSSSPQWRAQVLQAHLQGVCPGHSTVDNAPTGGAVPHNVRSPHGVHHEHTSAASPRLHAPQQPVQAADGQQVVHAEETATAPPAGAAAPLAGAPEQAQPRSASEGSLSGKRKDGARAEACALDSACMAADADALAGSFSAASQDGARCENPREASVSDLLDMSGSFNSKRHCSATEVASDDAGGPSSRGASIAHVAGSSDDGALLTTSIPEGMPLTAARAGSGDAGTLGASFHGSWPDAAAVTDGSGSIDRLFRPAQLRERQRSGSSDGDNGASIGMSGLLDSGPQPRAGSCAAVVATEDSAMSDGLFDSPVAVERPSMSCSPDVPISASPLSVGCHFARRPRAAESPARAGAQERRLSMSAPPPPDAAGPASAPRDIPRLVRGRGDLVYESGGVAIRQASVASTGNDWEMVDPSTGQGSVPRVEAYASGKQPRRN